MGWMSIIHIDVLMLWQVLMIDTSNHMVDRLTKQQDVWSQELQRSRSG